MSRSRRLGVALILNLAKFRAWILAATARILAAE
jgi:hypothetical protein